MWSHDWNKRQNDGTYQSPEIKWDVWCIPRTLGRKRFGNISWKLYRRKVQLSLRNQDAFMDYCIIHENIGNQNGREKGIMGSCCKKKSKILKLGNAERKKKLSRIEWSSWKICQIQVNEIMNSFQGFLVISWNLEMNMLLFCPYAYNYDQLSTNYYIIRIGKLNYSSINKTISKENDILICYSNIYPSFVQNRCMILNLFTGDMNIKYNFSFFYCLSFCLFQIIINSSIAISCKYDFILFNTICLSSSFHSQIAICLLYYPSGAKLLLIHVCFLLYITLLENNSWTNS